MKYDELVEYYDRELDYLRKAGVEFARKYPKIAQRLELQSTGAADPHVERLIEAFAFLTARVQRKLDDEFSEISEALLSVIYPHFLAPIPSLSILQLHLDSAKGRSTDKVLVPRNTQVYSRPVAGSPCTFRTCYDVELWPVSVSSARIGTPQPELNPPARAQSVLTLELQCPSGFRFQELSLERLRFYLHGAPRQVYPLYEFLLNQVTDVAFVDPVRPERVLGMDSASACLEPVGFERDEGLLPYHSRSLLGYRLLLEYFVLPQKFLFIDLKGLQAVLPSISQTVLKVLLYSEQPYSGPVEAIDENVFQLGCTPIVNLFKKVAERLQVEHATYEYCVVPDRFRQRALEVYSIECVRGLSRADSEQVEYRPFYSTSHSERQTRKSTGYWYAHRRNTGRESDQGTDLYLSFVNLDFDPLLPASEVLMVETLCTNRDLPTSLPFGEARGDFHIEGFPIRTTQCLMRPTPVRRLPLGKGVQWRLIAHLALNHASLTDPTHGRENLLEVLRLYDFQESESTEQQISGIASVSCRPIAARVVSDNGESGVARGYDITIEFDPSRYVGSSIFLFASVIERFLSLYVAINSFCKVSVRLKGKEGHLKQWRPRAGNQYLL